ncbi:MAG: U32 family peptidase [Gammaproteobacteria bacterium]|nr:U32 family peptidase [Gammaproteobacteria bacterium]
MNTVNPAERRLQLAVGSIPYFWPKQQVEDFYAALVKLPVDTVYIGETVCSKRRALSAGDWFELGCMLSDSGKEVVLSSLALIEAWSELSMLKKLAANFRFMIEANDLAGVDVAIEHKQRFVTGPTVNIYNGHTLSTLVSKGLQRWVPPVELSAESIRAILDEFSELRGYASESRVETEVFGYGRLPLAHSARCFTARYHGRTKDTCRFACLENPQGLPARTRDGEPFLRLNGIQVQSDAVHAVTDVESLEAAGATRLRLSPTGDDFLDVVTVYADLLDGKPATLPGENLVAGYWFGQPGMAPAPGG